MAKRASKLSRDDIKRLHDFVSTVNKNGETRKRYGGVTQAAEYFGVTRATINNWLKKNPERPKDEDDYREILDALASNIEQVQRAVKDVTKYFDNCVVIDLLELRMNRELLGESIEQQREKVFKTIANGGKDKSRIEERINERISTCIKPRYLLTNID